MSVSMSIMTSFTAKQSTIITRIIKIIIAIMHHGSRGGALAWTNVNCDES